MDSCPATHRWAAECNQSRLAASMMQPALTLGRHCCYSRTSTERSATTTKVFLNLHCCCYRQISEHAGQAFEALGSTLEEHVQLLRVEPAAYRVFFAANGGWLDLLSDVPRMMAQLEGVESGAGQYLGLCDLDQQQLMLPICARTKGRTCCSKT